MNKTDLIAFVSEELGETKKMSKAAVDAVLAGVGAGLVRDGDVTLVGFGKFQVKDRKARTARNPKTGESIQVPAKKVPTFKASQALKDAVAE